MKRIKLSKKGTFLSGRSLASEFIKEYFDRDFDANEEIYLDFNGVENISQAFLSEFLHRIKDLNVNIKCLVYENLNNEIIKSRVYEEVERVESSR